MKVRVSAKDLLLLQGTAVHVAPDELVGGAMSTETGENVMPLLLAVLRCQRGDGQTVLVPLVAGASDLGFLTGLIEELIAEMDRVEPGAAMQYHSGKDQGSASARQDPPQSTIAPRGRTDRRTR